VIDTSINKVTATVEVGKNPTEIAVSPDGKKVYVTNTKGGLPSGGTVSVIDSNTYSVEDLEGINIGVPDFNGEVRDMGMSYWNPVGIAVSPDGTKKYVAYYDHPISVIDTSKKEIYSVDTGKYIPYIIAENPEGTKLFASDGKNIFVIDTSNNNVIDTVKGIGGASENYHINGIAVNPDGKEVYVAWSYGSNVWTNEPKVAIFDTATNSFVAGVSVGDSPERVAFNGKSEIHNSSPIIDIFNKIIGIFDNILHIPNGTTIFVSDGFSIYSHNLKILIVGIVVLVISIVIIIFKRIKQPKLRNRPKRKRR